MNPQELWDSSAEAWISVVPRDLNRLLLLDEPMLRLAGNVSGLSVCDVGCGEGRFCRMLSERGARTIGIDPTLKLVETARRLHADGEYFQASAEALPLAASAFDLVVSYLVLIDVPDYKKAIVEMARILKPGGRLLIANLNSFCTTRPVAWAKDDQGQPLHVAVDEYFTEREERVGWCGIDIVNHHRPFEAYIQSLLATGLRLTDFEEPRLTEKHAREYPRMADARRVPLFHVMQWRKE